MPQTYQAVKNYKDLRTPIIPQPVACMACHSIYGQKYRVDKNDKAKGHICKPCLVEVVRREARNV